MTAAINYRCRPAQYGLWQSKEDIAEGVAN